MPAYWTKKRERQYKHIKKTCEAKCTTKKCKKTCERIAAATVNKARKKAGETKLGKCPCSQ